MFILVFLLVAGDGDVTNRAVCDAALAPYSAAPSTFTAMVVELGNTCLTNTTCLANSQGVIAAPLSGQLQKLSVIEVGKFGTQGSKHGRCGDARPPTQSNQPRAHWRNERPAHTKYERGPATIPTPGHPACPPPQRPRVLAHTSDTMTVPRLVADVTPGPDDCPDCPASQHLGQHVSPPAPCQAEELSAPGQQHGNPEMSHGTVA